MAKLVQYWYDRNQRVRAGIVWALVFQLIRIVFWYISQNVGFASMDTARIIDYFYKGFGVLELLAVLYALLGAGSDVFSKRRLKDDVSIKMADGRYMVKK
jgi:hypothetical protein